MDNVIFVVALIFICIMVDKRVKITEKKFQLLLKVIELMIIILGLISKR